MRYCDLPRNSQLCLTLYEYCGPGKYTPVGGTTLTLFGKLGVYKQVYRLVPRTVNVLTLVLRNRDSTT